MKSTRLAIMLLAMMSSIGMTLAQKPDCRLLADWSQKGPARMHEPDNLFDYMNGNAEGYLVYHFVRLNGVTCQNAAGDNIVMDIYEMENADFAYGIFMSNRDGRQPLASIGTIGQILPRKGAFVKDKYYVELIANPAKDHTASLKAYAEALEKQISGQTNLPNALGWFPKDKLTADSIRMVPQSVLGIRLLKAGFVGQYEFGKGFLVPEESPASATQVFNKMKDRLEGVQSISAGDEAFCGTDRYLDGVCVFRRGRFVGGFASVKNGQNVRPETAQFAQQIKTN